MIEIDGISVLKTRGQVLIMLLAALQSLRGPRNKKEVISEISEKRWWWLHPEDSAPYPSQNLTSREPRWQTLIAWARNDGVERKLVLNEGHDSWEATTEGLNIVPKVKSALRSGQVDVRECYLWSPTFKALMLPSYSPSELDTPRPQRFYEDHLQSWEKSVQGNEFTRLLEKAHRDPETLTQVLDALQKHGAEINRK